MVTGKIPRFFTLIDMKPSTRQVVDKLEALRRQKHEFIIKHVPRLHRLLMEAFPSLKTYFNYAIAENEEDPTKLTLLRGKKIVARNF